MDAARLTNLANAIGRAIRNANWSRVRRNFVDLRKRFAALAPLALEKARQRFLHAEAILRAVGPEATLRRGYSITTDARGKIVHTVKLVRPKMKIRTRVQRRRI